MELGIRGIFIQFEAKSLCPFSVRKAVFGVVVDEGVKFISAMSLAVFGVAPYGAETVLGERELAWLQRHNRLSGDQRD
jgi:hypothetical protein